MDRMSSAEVSRRYREAHPDRVRETKRRYRQRNLDALRVADRENAVSERLRRREWLNAYKVNAGCTDCGYAAHPRALDFDHVGSNKVMDVGRLAHHRVSWERLMAEIAKCEVVCANCHRVRTAERESQIAKAMRVDKPPVEVDGQADLFGGEVA